MTAIPSSSTRAPSPAPLLAPTAAASAGCPFHRALGLAQPSTTSHRALTALAPAPPPADSALSPPPLLAPLLAQAPRVPPLLPSTNLFGHLFRFRNNPLDLLEEARGLGDTVRIRVGLRYLTVVFNAEAVHHVLVEKQPNYVKQTRGYQALRRLLGNGLLTSEGAFWKRQRKIAQPAFGQRKLQAFAATFQRATEDLVKEWEIAASEGRKVDIAEAMNRLALRIAGETLFSLDISGESSVIGNALSDMLGGFLPTVTNPLLDYLPLPSVRRYKRGKAILDRVVMDLIARRRADDARALADGKESEHDDLLGMFMSARDEDAAGLPGGGAMSDEQLRDEVLTMLLAGHETTANALAWTFYHLARNPEPAARLQAELDTVLGSEGFTMEKYPHLVWTDQVLKEGMRLNSPAWIESRLAVEADTINGFHIPAGSFVFMTQYATHRHPRYWADPTRFDPTRFAPTSKDEPHLCPDGTPRPRLAYFPFSDGQRKCIGEHFAMMEQRIVLGILAKNFTFSMDPGFDVPAEASVTLRPSVPMWMTVEKR